MAGVCWMTSVLVAEWHLVPLRHGMFRQPAVCGGFVAGPVHRRLLGGPLDLPGWSTCGRCAELAGVTAE